MHPGLEERRKEAEKREVKTSEKYENPDNYILPYTEKRKALLFQGKVV
nr:MAG TPA: hypothetical protein [Caudoviricetes sp.]